MEHLIGAFFLVVSVGGFVASFSATRFLFRFVDLPLWLEESASFGFGLFGAVAAQLTVAWLADNWGCRRAGLRGDPIPFADLGVLWGTAVLLFAVAVALHYALAGRVSEEAEKWLIAGSLAALLAGSVQILTVCAERKRRREKI